MLQRNPIIAIIRADQSVGLADACAALYAGGLEAVEVTLNTPDALTIIQQVRGSITNDCLIGAGTVRSADDARRAIDAGAQFLVAPTFDRPTVEAAVAASIPICPGAYTPTEVAVASDAGATMVKVFPADNLGPAYIKALLAPMPELRLVPTGGVRLTNLADYIAAGAVAVGVGGSLVSPTLVAAKQWDRLTADAESWTSAAAAWQPR